MYFEYQLKNAQSNLKKTWSILKNAISQAPKKSSSLSRLLVDNVEITDPLLMAKSFNDFFINAAKNIVDEIPPTDRPPDLAQKDDIPLFSLTDSPVTRTEISEVIKSLKDKFTQDFSGLSTHFIRSIADQILTPLHHLINISFSSSVFPSQLKIAKDIPLLKQGSSLCMDNYRPISLLSCFSKIFEKIVCNRLCGFLDINCLISPSQFGFRAEHSTIHPMMHFFNHVSKALNEKKHTLAIFCDLRKAFDSCNHQILLKKMSQLGIRGAALEWFSNYLTNRKQFVSINNTSSSMKATSLGVPQGSILGPILFLIYINNLPASCDLLSLLFADDTTLAASGENLADLIIYTNNQLHKISTYFRLNKLALNPKKTQFILISNSPTAKTSIIELNINNNNPDAVHNPSLVYPIERVSSASPIPAVKFLGVYFDPDLNFKYHLQYISSKIARSLFLLRRSKNILNANSLQTLYYSLVHCHLIYGNQIWSSGAPSSLTVLHRKQKAAIRIITSSPYNAHTEPLFKTLNILPLPSLCEFFRLQFMQRFIQGLLPSSFNNIWVTNSAYRSSLTSMALRNSDDFYIPFARLTQTSNHPYFLFPRLWDNFKEENIKILREKIEFNRELKHFLVSKLSAVVDCQRLFCPSCSKN
jgi:hypothetical protein